MYTCVFFTGLNIPRLTHVILRATCTVGNLYRVSEILPCSTAPRGKRWLKFEEDQEPTSLQSDVFCPRGLSETHNVWSSLNVDQPSRKTSRKLNACLYGPRVLGSERSLLPENVHFLIRNLVLCALLNAGLLLPLKLCILSENAE